MKQYVKAIVIITLFPAVVFAQQSTFRDSLLDHMTGEWVLDGIIDSAKTTHDVSIAWVLGHQYLQLHESSREKNLQGTPAYEAIVYIGWDKPSGRYVCLWLDVTGGGGLSPHAFGYATKASDTLAFLFKSGSGGVFHTTMIHHPATADWQWVMDDEQNGVPEPFARLTMKRKK